MDLYIYNPAIELQGVIDAFTSFRWRRRFFEPGEFELHCSATPEILSLLTEENIIHRLDRREAGIIEGIKIHSPDNGTGDEIVATGRMGSSMLDRRIITPTVNFSGTVEDAMRKIVSDNAITARPLPHLVLGTAAHLEPTASFQAAYKTALTVCEALGRAAPLGFRVRLDIPQKRWIFEVYGGTDHSVTQERNPLVLFSDEFQNIKGAAYSLNNTGYANYAIVGGENNGDGRVILYVDRTHGEPSRELWVDANDLKSTADAEDDFTGNGSAKAFTLSHLPSSVSSVSVGGTPTSDYTQSGRAITFAAAPASGAAIAVSYAYSLTPEEYSDLLTQRGIEKLTDAAKPESFSADAVSTENFQYLTDWDLGDIVSFEKWGVLLNQRITEVEEIYENGVATVTPVCGNPLPDTLNLGDDI